VDNNVRGEILEQNSEYLDTKNSGTLLESEELTLDEISRHPIIERVAKRVADDVHSTSHTAHNSHYSSNA
jgi:hypothetical protein